MGGGIQPLFLARGAKKCEVNVLEVKSFKSFIGVTRMDTVKGIVDF